MSFAGRSSNHRLPGSNDSETVKNDSEHRHKSNTFSRFSEIEKRPNPPVCRVIAAGVLIARESARVSKYAENVKPTSLFYTNNRRGRVLSKTRVHATPTAGTLLIKLNGNTAHAQQRKSFRAII